MSGRRWPGPTARLSGAPFTAGATGADTALAHQGRGRLRFRAFAGCLLLASTVVPAVLAAPASAAPPAPVWSHTFGGWNRSSSPVIADVNGDGRNDIVHGHQDGYVRVLDAATGTNLPGWPQPNQVRPGVATAIDGSPAVGDLDQRRYERGRRTRGLDVESEPAGRHRGLPSRRIDQVPVRDARRRQRVGEHGRRRRLPGRRVLVARARRRRRRQLSRHRVRRLGPAHPRDRSQLSASCPASP